MGRPSRFSSEVPEREAGAGSRPSVPDGAASVAYRAAKEVCNSVACPTVSAPLGPQWQSEPAGGRRNPLPRPMAQPLRAGAQPIPEPGAKPTSLPPVRVCVLCPPSIAGRVFLL